jgi:YfiH family protein
VKPLPAPDGAFCWTAASWGDVLHCTPLAAIAQHGFTTRQLALRGGPETHPQEWTALARAVDGSIERLARVRQVHGRAVRVLRKGETSGGELLQRPEADAMVSNDPGLALVVVVADCAPIVMTDPRTGAAAAVHAGWRGTCAGVAGAAVAALGREFGTSADDLIAAIGPSIGACCYEVGDDLVGQFQAAGHPGGDLERWFSRVRRAGANDGWSLRLDVARANRDQLVAAGLRPQRVHSCGLCTHTHQEIFDSFRADGNRAGRMAGIIRVPAPGSPFSSRRG